MQTVNIPMESLAEVIQLQLKNGGKATLTVTGSSMLPLLRNRRDMVTLVPPTELKNGDVVLFARENGAYILHRIIAVAKDGYICCGDNQAVREPVTREQIVAVVDGFTRKGKWHTCQSFGYRLYTAVWVGFFFLRPCYIGIRRLAGRIRKKL